MKLSRTLRQLGGSLSTNEAVIQSSLVTVASYFLLGGNLLSLLPLLVTCSIKFIVWMTNKHIDSSNRIKEKDLFRILRSVKRVKPKYNICLYNGNQIVDTPHKSLIPKLRELNSQKCQQTILYIDDITLYISINLANTFYGFYLGNSKDFNKIYEACKKADIEKYGNVEYLTMTDTPNYMGGGSSTYSPTNLKLTKPMFGTDYYTCYNTLKDQIDLWQKHHDKYKALCSGKLGFVFHGKPGCGKTTLAFAIAHYVGADIIKLSIQNNKLIEPTIQSKKKYVLVLDDLDVLLEYNREDEKNLKEDKKKKELKKALKDGSLQITSVPHMGVSNVGSSIYSSMMPILSTQDDETDKDEDSEDSEDSEDKEDKTMTFLGKLIEDGSKIQSQKKSLFYDLLNFLDNDIKYSNCIIIITTNYVDKFDEALFRPGRIDRVIEIEELPVENIRNIIKQWFNMVDPELNLKDEDLEFINDDTTGPLTLSVIMNKIKKNIVDFNGFKEAFIESN